MLPAIARQLIMRSVVSLFSIVSGLGIIEDAIINTVNKGKKFRTVARLQGTRIVCDLTCLRKAGISSALEGNEPKDSVKKQCPITH